MKQAVVFHLASSNWGVIESYLGRSGHHALVVDGEALGSPDISRHAGRIATLDSLLATGDKGAAEDSIREALDRSPFLFVGKDWDALCAKHGFPADTMRLAMRQDLAREWGREAMLVDALERAGSLYAIGAVVLNEEFSAESTALALWAGQRGVPVLNLCDAFPLDGRLLADLDLQADKLAVSGPRQAETFRDLGLLPDRTMPTGNPAWIKYAELAVIKGECRAALARLIGWGTGPLVVFGTTAAPFRTATSDPGILEEAVRAFFKSARSLAVIHPSAIWAVLVRPSDPPGLESEMKSWAAGEGLPAGRIHFFRNDPELFVAAARVVVSVDSCLSIEALLAGTPAVNVLTDSGWRTGPAFAADTGVAEVPAEGLEAEIAKALTGEPDPRMFEAAKAAYHPAAQGDPVRNVVDWITATLAPAG